MTINYHEKRKHPRIDKNLPLRIIEADANIVTETNNISRSGAYCKVNRYIAPLTKLDLILLLPMLDKSRKNERKIECGGVVVRADSTSDNSFNIAIFFNRIKEEDSQLISDYVEWYLKGKNN